MYDGDGVLLFYVPDHRLPHQKTRSHFRVFPIVRLLLCTEYVSHLKSSTYAYRQFRGSVPVTGTELAYIRKRSSSKSRLPSLSEHARSSSQCWMPSPLYQVCTIYIIWNLVCLLSIQRAALPATGTEFTLIMNGVLRSGSVSLLSGWCIFTI